MSPPALAIRQSTRDDEEAILRLAQLDSSNRAPAAPGAIVAEVGGRMVAAVGADGTAVADPFAHTSALVEFMRAGAGRLVPAAPVISLRRRPRDVILRRVAAS